MKRGFTLIELLAVIVVVALISIIAFPSILNQFSKSKKDVNNTSEKVIIESGRLYLENNVNLQKYKSDLKICVSLEMMVREGLLKKPIKDLETGSEINTYSYGVQFTYHANTKVLNEEKIGSLSDLECDELYSIPW